MALENKWVTYLQRSYKSIKAALINRMTTLVPEMTDQSESNIFVIIVNSFAGLIEQLNYYIDNVARESFITTARRYSSLVKLTRLIDYRVRAKVGATVDILITAVDSSGDPVLLDADETLSAGLIVSDGSIEFITTEKVTIFAGTSSSTVPAKQRVLVSSDNLGTTSSAADQTFTINDDYQHDTLQIEINSVTWTLVKSFAFSGPQDTHFIVEVDENKEASILFGDDVNGAIPPNGQSVLATYYTCSGLSGNVESNTITTWDTPAEPGPTPPVQTPTITEYTITNELPAVGGQDEEGIEGIRKHAPLSLRTLDRAVTLQDHLDICLLVPGVGKAGTVFDQKRKEVIFYVAPEEGGTAPSQLLTDVVNYFDLKKMITTTVVAYAAGETKLRITLDVTVKFRRSTADAETDIKEALEAEFGFNNSDVDRQIRKSDIIALIDNLDKVDYLTLTALTTKPYPRIVSGSNQLEANWYITVDPTSSEIASWRMTVLTGGTTARIWRTDSAGVITQESTDITIAGADQGATDWTSDDGTLKLGVWKSGGFTKDDQWTWKTYPYNEDHEFEDFTIPIYDVSELSLTVNEQVGVS